MKSNQTGNVKPKMKTGLPICCLTLGTIAAAVLAYWLSMASYVGSLALSFIFAAGIILILLLFGFGFYSLFLANEIRKENKRIEGEGRRQQIELKKLEVQAGSEKERQEKQDFELKKFLAGIKREILIKWLDPARKEQVETKEMMKFLDDLDKTFKE